MKTIGRVLLVCWALLALGVALIFAVPKLASQVLHPIASYFQLIPMILLVATAFTESFVPTGPVSRGSDSGETAPVAR